MSKLSSFLHVMKYVAGPVLVLVGVPPVFIPLVQHGIEIAESHPGTGAAKKILALDAIKTGLEAVSAAKPGSVDVPAAIAVIDKGIDTVVGTINLVNKRGA